MFPLWVEAKPQAPRYNLFEIVSMFGFDLPNFPNGCATVVSTFALYVDRSHDRCNRFKSQCHDLKRLKA